MFNGSRFLWFLCIVGLSSLPGLQSFKISVNSVNLVRHLVSGFTEVRHHSQPEYKQHSRNYVEAYLKRVLPKGVHTKQVFSQDISGKVVEGVNYITAIPSLHRGKESDEILVLVAPYDTSPTSPGVNNGGSGIALILEVARILGDLGSSENHSCGRTRSVIIALVDFQQNDFSGTRHFFEEWLIPKVLGRSEHSDDVIYGIINIGSLLTFDTQPDSQAWPHWNEFPAISRSMMDNGFRGEFISTISREKDESLENSFKNMWNMVTNSKPEYQKFKYTPIKVSSETSSNLSQDLLQSGHHVFGSFEKPSYQTGIPALTITDTGKLRGYMKECFQDACDDMDHVTDESVTFWKVITEVTARLTVAVATDDLDLGCLTKVFHDHRTTKGRDKAVHSDDEL